SRERQRRRTSPGRNGRTRVAREGATGFPPRPVGIACTTSRTALMFAKGVVRSGARQTTARDRPLAAIVYRPSRTENRDVGRFASGPVQSRQITGPVRERGTRADLSGP